MIFDEARVVDGTLDWCNAVRAARGMEPLDVLPPGRRSDSDSCPCGKATGLSVGTMTWAVQDGSVSVPSIEEAVGYMLPEVVTQFVVSFDAGDLPQYDETLQ